MRRASRPPSPLARRRAIMAFASGCQCAWVSAMRWIAALSCRLPVRLSRCRDGERFAAADLDQRRRELLAKLADLPFELSDLDRERAAALDELAREPSDGAVDAFETA